MLLAHMVVAKLTYMVSARRDLNPHATDYSFYKV